MTARDDQKREAAHAALSEVQSGMTVGLGTGSTASHFIRELGRRVRSGLNVAAIATSIESERLALEWGVPLVTFAVRRVLDLTVDGADEVSPDLQLIKGLGGALVREKVVAKASRRLVIVVDESKLVDKLGSRAPVPVEVVPFATEIVAQELEAIGGLPRLRERDGEAFVSDNGNHIVDWSFGPITDPVLIERRVKSISGVVDSGIFADLAHRVIVSGASGVRFLDREMKG